MHRRLCNVYHLTQGNVKQVIYTVPRPLQYLRLLHNHPDLDQLSQHLTDKVFTQMYRRQPECQPLLALAAYLGKVEFLTFLAKHNAWFHPLERLLCIAVRGHRPRSAAELFERWTKVHRPTVSSVEMLLQVYGGRSEYMAEIDTVHRALETVKIPCTCTSVRTPQLIQQWRERHLERMIACDDLEGLRGYAAELDPELKSSGYLLQKLLNRNRADLLVRLVESAVADPATVSRVNRVRNYNLRESVFTRPNLLQFQKRILAALIAARPVSQAREAPTVLEFLTEQLRRMGLDPIRPQSVEMQDIFLRVDIDEWRLAMLREQLVTVPEAAIMAMQGQSTSLSITFCYWTQYAKFMAFAYTDRSLWHEAKTHREVEMRALLDTYMSPCGQDDNNNNNNNKRHADEIPLHLVAKATSRVLQRTFLRSFLAINLDHEATARRILNQDSFVRRPAGSIWIGKEFIDQMLVEGSANENLEATALRKCDATLNPRNGRPSAYMDRTHMFWGPWYYSVKSLQRDIFDSFEDVLVMYAGEAIPKAEQSPSLITRTIAFLDPGLPIMELLGESWWKYILSWLQSLDTNMYCQFLASYLAPKD
ncbi:hypothetical protein BGZ73_000498 [Actinomortierella ambigua]|nr:hypothetical protein BGZ73_000498 [Actinomortierella ambigua]